MRFIDCAEPMVIGSYAEFERAFGPIPEEVVNALGRGLAPGTRSGTLKFTEFDEAAFQALLGGPPAAMTWGVAIQASQPLRTPCPRFWRHPLQWLRWNPLLTEGTLVTKLKLNDVWLHTEDGRQVGSWKAG